MVYEDKELADRLASFLKEQIDTIEERLSKKCLLDLKGKSAVDRSISGTMSV